MITHPYICLTTKEPLDDHCLKAWIQAIMQSSPSGVVVATQVPPENNYLRFYRRKIDGENCYIGSLMRNLNKDEADAIAKAFLNNAPTANGKITWSQEPYQDHKQAQIAEDLIKAIAIEAARMNHNRWVQTRMDEGWRYAAHHNSKMKTSPICKNWDHLPEAYKRAEYHRVKTLLEIFDQLNLKLVKR